MLSFLKNKTEKNPNKFEKISPDPYIELAKKDPHAASKKLKERYVELTDVAQPHAIAGIYKDEYLQDWLKLAELLSGSDPVAAKSIYMPLLRTRNFQSEQKNTEDFLLVMQSISQNLYDLENKFPEQKEEAKLAVVSTLVNCSSPDQAFWQECLEQMFRLASVLTKPEEEGYMGAIALTAYYADNIAPALKERALNEASQRLRDERFLVDSKNPTWSKGYFFKRMNDFCIEETISSRNISFAANPNADLYKLLGEIFWLWVERHIRQQECDALVLLQHAIHSHDKKLSLEASKAYTKNFYEIAVHDPPRASECLRSVASYSCCYFTEERGTEERHQNYNLYEVFDETIPVLMKLDKELGILPFFAFLKSHGNVPQRMRQKYQNEINTALSIQIKNRKS